MSHPQELLMRSRIAAIALATTVGFSCHVTFAQAPKAVQVHASNLTTGIPGSGPLRENEVKQWLADQANHEAFTIELPMGLDLGKDAIAIPKDNPLTRAKIELGRQLYFDRRLSKNAEVSCADCHHPDHGYAFPSPFGIGVAKQTGNRNSPVAYNRILSTTQFWDGRAASLEEQAKGPIANPIEMASSHEATIDFLKKNAVYRMQFEKVFGRAPHIDDVAKAIASFERVLITGPSPFDANEPLRKLRESLADELEDLDALKKEQPALYAKYEAAKSLAEVMPMSESAVRGRELFMGARGNCAACHVGANFTDEKYHNLGVGMDAAKPDLGRYEITKSEADKGAFKTPTVRNIAQTAPYMHDGSQKTLEEVVDWYVKGGHPNPYLSDKVRKIDMSASEKADLVEFMKALTGAFPKVEQGRLPQ